MDIEIFLALLVVFSIVTSLTTQAIKCLLDSLKVKYASNVIVLIASVIIGIGGMVAFYILNGHPWTSTNITFIVLMVLANWLCAMLGYDKIMQAIQQIKKV